jgi:hypothetical protein
MDLLSSIKNLAFKNKLKEKALLWTMFIPKGKYAIIADNHGFLNVYKETICEILQKHTDLKGIFHLGDMFGANATVKDCIACLRFTVENKIIALKGNHCRNLLNCDTKHRYSDQMTKFNKKLFEALKEEYPLYEKLLQFPDKIETDYFDLVHSSSYRPYYSNNRYNNDFCVTYDMITKPVFASHEHRFQMRVKAGIASKKIALEFDHDILIDKPCVISVPTMNYSRERNKYHHGYVIMSILDDGDLSIRAYHLDKNFQIKERRIRNIESYEQITIKNISWS